MSGSSGSGKSFTMIGEGETQGFIEMVVNKIYDESPLGEDPRLEVEIVEFNP